MQESPIKREAAWVPPLTIEMQTLKVLERIEKLIAEHILTQTHPKQVVPSQNAVPKPIGKKR